MHHTARNLTLSALLSRRDFLHAVGIGAIALSSLERLTSAAGAQGRRGGLPRLQAAPTAGTLQLPFWSDAGWSQPEYYETIQTGLRRQPKTARFPSLTSTYADVNSDGQDEL